MPLWTETWSSAGGVSLCPGTGSLMAREGEEQSQRQQGTPWMLEKPRFCQSCVGEVSLGSFALRSFPLRGLGVGDVKAPPPQGLHPCTTSSGPGMCHVNSTAGLAWTAPTLLLPRVSGRLTVPHPQRTVLLGWGGWGRWR